MIIQNNKKGFTLIELTVFIAVVGMLLPLIAVIVINTTRTTKLASANLKLQADGRRINETIDEFIKQSSELVTSGVAAPTDNNTIAMKLPSIDANQNLLVSEDIVIIDYDSSTKKLTRQIIPAAGSIRPATTTILSSDVESVNFMYLDKNGTVITDPINATDVISSITLKKTVGNQQTTINIANESRLRNR